MGDLPEFDKEFLGWNRPSNNTTCGRCLGSGQVVNEYILMETGDTIMQDCFVCQGTGHIEASKPDSLELTGDPRIYYKGKDVAEVSKPDPIDELKANANHVLAEQAKKMEAAGWPTPQADKGINEKLGLPFGKMKWIVVAVDVDGTLIDSGPTYYEPIIELVKTLSKFKNIKIVVWSGGGKDYAARWGRLLSLDEYVWKYASKTEHKEIQPDIAVDDIQDTAIGAINLIVRNK